MFVAGRPVCVYLLAPGGWKALPDMYTTLFRVSVFICGDRVHHVGVSGCAGVGWFVGFVAC